MDHLKVTRVGDHDNPVKEGDEIMVDNNLPATFLRAVSPGCGDDETGEWWHGRVEVRYSWGAVEEIDDVRASLFVDEV